VDQGARPRRCERGESRRNIPGAHPLLATRHLPALSESALPGGVPLRGDSQTPGRDCADRSGEMHRLPRLRRSLSLRCDSFRSRGGIRTEVHPLQPPDRPGAGTLLCEGVHLRRDPSIRLLKNAHLLRFPHPSPFNVPQSTPHGSGYRGPCLWAFLNSLPKRLFQFAYSGIRRTGCLVSFAMSAPCPPEHPLRPGGVQTIAGRIMPREFFAFARAVPGIDNSVLAESGNVC